MFYRSLSLVSVRLYQILGWTVDTNMLTEPLFDSKQPRKVKNPLEPLRVLPSQLLSYVPPPYSQPFNFPKKKG